MSARTSEIRVLKQSLLSHGSVRIDRPALWRLWCAAAPRLVGSPCQNDDLIESLRILRAEGTIELPSPESSARAPWPSYVTVPTSRRVSRSQPWKSHAWCAQLGWAASMRTLSPELFEDLKAINDWLSRNVPTITPIVPARFRSAEIFGREKRLDELTRTTLFGPTRITLDLLACTRLAPPLPGAIVGPGPDVLITENSDPYWVLVDLLRDAPGHRIGVVAWGSGRSFPTQVDSLRVDVAGRGPITGTAWYWGDCDPAGLAIADAAASVTAEIPIRPATGLWAAMARSPVQERGSVDWTGDRGARWLGTELWSQLEPVRSARGRIAQEAVSVSAISEWVDGSG